jgi:hypothetical protein
MNAANYLLCLDRRSRLRRLYGRPRHPFAGPAGQRPGRHRQRLVAVCGKEPAEGMGWFRRPSCVVDVAKGARAAPRGRKP